MFGPHILARTLSERAQTDKHGNPWQYNSRSDHHSKVACWAILFDLLNTCPLLKKHVKSKRVAFGINHEMRDFRTGRKKDLDLVLCTSTTAIDDGRPTFLELTRKYDIRLAPEEEKALARLPVLRKAPVGSVLLALEAKACMTEHGKARPRLYDELASSFSTVLGDTNSAIAAGFVCINIADSFVSPGLNKRRLGKASPKVNEHRQPRAAYSVIEKIKELPRRSTPSEHGFDAIGIVLLSCRNDGSPVTVADDRPADCPMQPNYEYPTMVDRIATFYSTRFQDL